MMSSAKKVFQNRKILSKVFEFLGNDSIRKEFLPTFNKQILIYGQVQSGKTAKIMEYIKNTDIKTEYTGSSLVQIKLELFSFIVIL